MAFKVKEINTVERYCPNGHPPLPDLWPEDNHSVKFCYECGASIEERQTNYDAALCANCDNPVHPSWNYCPYCGQGREQNQSGKGGSDDSNQRRQ